MKLGEAILIIWFIIILAFVSFAQDTTSTIVLTFSEPMKQWDLSVLDNYKVTDSKGKVIPVYSTGYSLDWIQKDSGLIKIALLLPRLQYKETYIFIVSNVRDLAGNFIGDQNTVSFFFNGFAPDKISIPIVQMKK